ncbi:MAG TPA: TetR/AcrR family transcriptional regulator [Pseudonocardiaceae bacterium]|nr:TetR/AcrR family transcriptional regulator [Pseudonocardiaceae bacterium]
MPPTSSEQAPTATSGARRATMRKGDRTGQAILDTVAGLLGERQISEITVDEIAKGAGISRSAFYFHYDSREAVLLALSERLHEQLYLCGAAWFRRGDESPAEALHRAVSMTIALWREHGPILRAGVRVRDTDPRLHKFWADTGSRFFTAVADHIDRERAAGLAIPGPPTAKRLAALLVNMNEQACIHYSMTPHTDKGDADAIEAVSAVWMRSVYGI